MKRIDEIKAKALRKAVSSALLADDGDLTEKSVHAALMAYDRDLWQEVDRETIPRKVPVIIYNCFVGRSYPRVFAEDEIIGINVTHWRPEHGGPHD